MISRIILRILFKIKPVGIKILKSEFILNRGKIMTTSSFSRYKTELNSLFEEESVLELQLEVERALAKANYLVGKIPKEAWLEINKFATKEYIKLDRVKEIEEKTQHDIMSLVLAISEQCQNFGGYVHMGATSNDIKDTVLGLQMKKSKEHLISNIDLVLGILLNLAHETKAIACIGRTHGQHAIPMTYGFKFANFAFELFIARQNFEMTKVDYGKMSGAIGNYASFGTKEIEEIMLKELNLEPLLISTQVITRIVHSKFIYALTLVTSVIERLAREIRNLQRTEINEIQEIFLKDQVGSSTMPQKRNPYLSERICGISRFIRQMSSLSLENICLEHERDLTNSSTERILIPQTIILVDYILIKIGKVLKRISLNPEQIRKNLFLEQGKQCAENLMLELTPYLGRQEAHQLVKNLSSSDNFLHEVKNSIVSNYIDATKIDEILNPENYLGLSLELTDHVI
ncbi:MAG: adenylosuccinate lyase, partial [Asgard group archaeon]|nr:adenylosuccinate lyase [Asgard group archaeon]